MKSMTRAAMMAAVGIAAMARGAEAPSATLSGELNGWWVNLLHLGADFATDDFYCANENTGIATDYLAGHGGEANQMFRPAPGVACENLSDVQSSCSTGDALVWTPYETDNGEGYWCDNFKDHYVKYWHVYIIVPGSQDREVTFWCNHDDGIMMWVNGELQVDNPQYNGGDDSFEGTLYAGVNAVTIKLAEGGGGDHMRMRAEARNGSNIDDLTWQLFPARFVVSDPAVKGVTADSATLSANLEILAGDAFTLTAVIAEGGADLGADTNAWAGAGARFIPVASPGEGRNECLADELDAKTDYTFRFFAAGGADNDLVWSDPLTFKTLGDPPALADVAESGVGGWSADINGTLDAGTFADVFIAYGTNAAALAWTNVVGTLMEGASFSETLDGLLFATDYFYEAVATNAVGAGSSGVLSFRTLGGAPTVAASHMSGLGARRAVVNGGLNAGGLAFVSVEVTPVSPPGAPFVYDFGLFEEGPLSLLLTGLEPLASYSAVITATNACGSSASGPLSFATVVGNNMIYVDAANGDDASTDPEDPAKPFKSVTRALQVAAGADTIFMFNGIYSPNRTGEVFPMTIPPGVNLVGEDIRGTVLHASNFNGPWPWEIDRNAGFEILFVSGSTELGSFTFTGASDSDHAKNIVVTGGAPLLRDLVITANRGKWERAAICVRNDACPVIRNCMIYGNASAEPGGTDERSAGIRLEGGPDSRATIEHCNIFSNYGSGIWKNNDSRAVLRNNIIVRNTIEMCVALDGTVECYNNLVGLDPASPWQDPGVDWTTNVFGNIAGDPLWERGVYLGAASPCVGAATNINAVFLAGYTTRADGQATDGADIGFHYPPGTKAAGTVRVSEKGSDSAGDGSPGNPWRTIAFALANVGFGGEVLVMPGTYSERAPFLIPDGVAVRGADPLTTRVHPENAGMAFTAYGNSWFVVEGLTIGKIPWGADFGSAVYAHGSQGTVRDCRLVGNFGLWEGGGMRVLNGAHMTVRNCVFASNVGRGEYVGALSLYNGAGLDLEKCTFLGNMTANQGNASAISVSFNTGLITPHHRPISIRNSIFDRNAGTDFKGVTADMISHCFVGGGQFAGVNNCVTGDAKLTRWLYLGPDSPCVDAGDRPASGDGTTQTSGAPDTGMLDLGFHAPAGQLPGADYYVDALHGDDGNNGLAPGAGNAFKTIRKAVEQSQTDVGVNIHVAAGEYAGGVENYPLHLPSGVSVRGDGMATTLLDLEGREAAFVIRGVDGVTVDGFTICNSGNFDTSSAIAIDRSSPLIQNIRSTNNYGRRSGGGVFFEYASPTLRNCVFDWNWNADAGATGGAITLGEVSANVFIENCVFAYNNIVNTGERRGGRGNPGGAIAIQNGRAATIRNCVFIGNGDDMAADGIYDVFIGYENGGDNDGMNSAGPTLVENCNFERMDPDAKPHNADYVACASLDPRFSDKSTPEAPYQLAKDSPLRRAGVKQDWMTGATDILGNPRLYKNWVDIGPYQLPGDPATLFLVR